MVTVGAVSSMWTIRVTRAGGWPASHLIHVSGPDTGVEERLIKNDGTSRAPLPKGASGLRKSLLSGSLAFAGTLFVFRLIGLLRRVLLLGRFGRLFRGGFGQLFLGDFERFDQRPGIAQATLEFLARLLLTRCLLAVSAASGRFLFFGPFNTLA